MVGGHIKIRKINFTRSNFLMHIVNSIGEKITSKETEIFINNFFSENIITENEAKLLKVATSDKILNVDINYKDKLRANIFKNMLLNLI